MSLIDALATGQVDQVELRDLDFAVFRAIFGVGSDVDAENGVGATRSFVQARLSDVSYFITLLHVAQDFLLLLDVLLSELVDVDALDALTHV